MRMHTPDHNEHRKGRVAQTQGGSEARRHSWRPRGGVARVMNLNGQSVEVGPRPASVFFPSAIPPGKPRAYSPQARGSVGRGREGLSTYHQVSACSWWSMFHRLAVLVGLKSWFGHIASTWPSQERTL